MERLARNGSGLGLGLAITLVFAASTGNAQKPEEKEKKMAPAAAPAAKPTAAPMAAAATAAPEAKPAAAPAPMPPPKPSSEMDQLKFFVGKWKCEGKAMASPMGPEHPIKGSAEAKMEGDGFWQAFTYEEKNTKEHMGFKTHGMWGWDAGMKKFVRAAAGNRGNWDSATAPGFEGDKITWTGDLSGPMGTMPFHHTFTKKSDKEWAHTFEIKTPDGKWAPLSEVTCKK